MTRHRYQKGFTIVELMVTIVIASIAMSIASSFLNFSWISQKRTVDEYEIQSDIRLAADTVNYAIRDASVTFAITEDVFNESKKEKWNYIGIEDNKEIVEYIWDPVNNTHDRVVLLPEKEKIFYNLYFSQSVPNTKLISYHLEGYFEGSESEKAIIESELAAVNSVAVEDGGSLSNPAIALAYRTDPKPQPEIVTTQKEVTIVVALVLDNSGSMRFDMDGHDQWNWRYDSSEVRNSILESKAKDLIDQFADIGNVKVSIIPFANNANDVSPMMDATTQKVALKNLVDNLYGYGGTNTGDGLRRGAHIIKDYSDDHSEEEIVNYLILLTDGEPTFYSSNSYYNYSPQVDDNNIHYLWGSGYSDSSNISNAMNYVDYVGQNVVVGMDVDISTFVIGFTAVADEITRAEDIATDSCTHDTNTARTGTYYRADSAVELERVFGEITNTILQETWHIYGPY